MKLTIFGANGPLGQQLVDQAVDRGHQVTAVVRSAPPESRFPDSVSIVEADIYAGEDVRTALEPATVVCNAFERSKLTPPDFVSVTGQNILETIDEVGVDRYLTVTSTAVRRDGEPCGIGESIMTTLYRLLRPTVWGDTADHVADVTATDLNWTVIRPLRLAKGEPTRQYKTGRIKLGVGSVPYGDVASFMLDCCERGTYVRMQPKIST